ncbi:MAG: M56 family metallopeptidase [Phycisphaerales bacterium JB043]
MDHQLMSWLWQNALGVLPIVAIAFLITRAFPMRPATRHAIWTGALVAFLIPPVFSSSLPVLPTLEQYTANQQEQLTGSTIALDPTPAPESHTTTIAPEPAPSYALPAPVIEHIVGKPGATRYTRHFGASSSNALSDLESTTPQRSAIPRTRPTTGYRDSNPITPLASETTTDTYADSTLATDPGNNTAPLNATSGEISSSGVVVDDSLLARWQVYLLAIRDDIVNIPPIPIALWIAGASVVLLVGAWRVVRFKWMLRSIEPAPAHVQSHVDRLASQLGLARSPRTVVCTQRITPMIYCGIRPILVLPYELWSQLDAPGRAAVIQHELAHLRRRDHWICWIESLVAVVYWWHPVAWWVRSRVRDEADLSCDAWVTALLPQYRRNYAEALVSTRKYISLPGRTPPSVGLGATRVRAKRFSRRLLMIMTTRSRPGLTLPGVALSLALLAGTAVTSPMWACPPDETEAEHREHSKQHHDEKDSQSTFEEYMEESGNESLSYEAQAALEQALKALHDLDIELDVDLDDLDDMMASLNEALAELASKSVEYGDKAHKYIDQEAMSQLAHAIGRLHTIVAPQNVNHEPPHPAADPQEPKAPTAHGYSFSASNADCAAIMQIPYELFGNSAKSEALVTIMIRDDVPTLVSPGDGVLVVHGNAATQDAFATFRAALSEEEYRKAYPLPQGKLEDVFNLMRLSDVPILVSMDDGAIVVHGNALEHKAFADFLVLVHPEGDGPAPEAHASTGVRRELEARAQYEAAREADRETRQRRAQAAQQEAQARQRAIQAEQRKAQAKQREAQAKQRQKEAKARAKAQERARAEQNECEANQQSRAMTGQSQELRREADKIRQAADRVMQRSQQNYNKQLNRLNASADKLRERANNHQNKLQERYEQHVHKTQSKAEQYYAQSEEYLSLAEQMREQAEAFEDELEELSEAIEEAEGRERDGLARRVDELQALIEKRAAKANGYDEKASAKRAAAEELFESLEGVEEEVEAQMEQLEAELEQSLEELEQAVEQLEAELEQAQEEAEAMREQAENIDEQAEEIDEAAEFDEDDDDDDPVA